MTKFGVAPAPALAVPRVSTAHLLDAWEQDPGDAPDDFDPDDHPGPEPDEEIRYQAAIAAGGAADTPLRPWWWAARTDMRSQCHRTVQIASGRAAREAERRAAAASASFFAAAA